MNYWKSVADYLAQFTVELVLGRVERWVDLQLKDKRLEKCLADSREDASALAESKRSAQKLQFGRALTALEESLAHHLLDLRVPALDVRLILNGAAKESHSRIVLGYTRAQRVWITVTAAGTTAMTFPLAYLMGTSIFSGALLNPWWLTGAVLFVWGQTIVWDIHLTRPMRTARLWRNEISHFEQSLLRADSNL